MSTLHEQLVERIDRSDEHRLIASWNAVRAVVELHTGAQDGHVTWCTECQGATWPCRTIDAVAEHLGVEIGETP